MGFNFSGMMQGLGGGLVATGQIMKEQEKMQWETEQVRLKYEREQHMAELARRSQKESQASQQNWQSGENRASEKAAAARQSETIGMQQKQLEATTAQGERSYNLQVRQGDQAAADREASRDLQEKQINKESDAMKIHKEEQASYQRMAEQMYPDDPNKQDIFVTAKLFGKGAENKPLSEAAIEAGQAQVDSFKSQNDGKEYKQAFNEYKKQFPKATQMQFDSLMVVQSAETISGRPNPMGSRQEPQSQAPQRPTVDTKSIEASIQNKDFSTAESNLAKLATIKDPRAAKEYERLASLLEQSKQEKIKSFQPQPQRSMLGGQAGF